MQLQIYLKLLKQSLPCYKYISSAQYARDDLITETLPNVLLLGHPTRLLHGGPGPACLSMALDMTTLNFGLNNRMGVDLCLGRNSGIGIWSGSYLGMDSIMHMSMGVDLGFLGGSISETSAWRQTELDDICLLMNWAMFGHQYYLFKSLYDR